MTVILFLDGYTVSNPIAAAGGSLLEPSADAVTAAPRSTRNRDRFDGKGIAPPDDGLPGTTADVDKAMGVVPSPEASKGIIIVNGKQMSFKVGAQPPEILVHQKDVIEFPYASGDQMLFLIDGDHLVIQFPGELGFLTLLNFQKYLTDPDTAAHIEWGLGGKTIASVEDVLSQLAPAAGLTELTPEAGELTAGERSSATDTPWIDLADRARNWIYNRYAGWIYIGHPEGAKGTQEGSGSAAGET